MFNLKLVLLWKYITERPSKFSTIIYCAKINWLVLILSEEMGDDTCILLHRNIENNFLFL